MRRVRPPPDRRRDPGAPLAGATILAVIALSVAAACGDGTPSETASPGASPAGSAAAQSPAPTGPTPSRSEFANPTLFPSTVPPSATPPPPSGSGKAPMEIAIGSRCVQPGETQSVSIATRGGYDFSWGTTWPDGENHPEWGAFDIGKIPPNGKYTKVFAIPPTAPTGAARSDFAVSGFNGGKAEQNTGFEFWEIAAQC